MVRFWRYHALGYLPGKLAASAHGIAERLNTTPRSSSESGNGPNVSSFFSSSLTRMPLRGSEGSPWAFLTRMPADYEALRKEPLVLSNYSSNFYLLPPQVPHCPFSEVCRWQT